MPRIYCPVLEIAVRSGHAEETLNQPLPGDGPLERSRCRVGGLNQNYTSEAGTLYHIQVEDLGPVLDRLTETLVRRVNVIVYANYGEANARIIHGRDFDFPDLRTREHNLHIQARIPELAGAARAVIEEKERWQIARIKGAIREYHRTKSESAKQYFTDANGLFPFLFSRAWIELKQEKDAHAAPAAAALTVPPEAIEGDEVLYPLEADLRECVLDIERLIEEVGRDLQRLRAEGQADDILAQTCRKLVSRARESIGGREGSEFNARRLDMTRRSLATTWRQIRSRLK